MGNTHNKDMQENTFPPLRPLPDSLRKRLQDVVQKVRPCLQSMVTGSSETIASVWEDSPYGVVIKLSQQQSGWQAMVLLNADAVLLFDVARFQLMKQGQIYEGSIEPAT